MVYYGWYLSLEAAILLKNFFESFGCSNYFNNDNYLMSSDFRFYYLLNSTVVNLETFGNVLFLGTNLRLEAPLLNSRLRNHI